MDLRRGASKPDLRVKRTRAWVWGESRRVGTAFEERYGTLPEACKAENFIISDSAAAIPAATGPKPLC